MEKRVEYQVIQYTEKVYFDGDEEFDRERLHDDMHYDTTLVREPTEQELEDIYN